jgi:hypothetical protein
MRNKGKESNDTVHFRFRALRELSFGCEDEQTFDFGFAGNPMTLLNSSHPKDIS